MEINIHEAKTHFSKLLKKVAEGEEVTISRAGVPVAKLIAAGPRGESRPLGMDKGTVWIADDFDVLEPELEALFYAPLDLGDGKKAKGSKNPKKSQRVRE